jgi:hypothetical protein
MTPFIQGAIAAATTACLYRHITTAKETQESWENIALGANHLFLVVQAALLEGRIRSTIFFLCSKAVFVLTPVVLIYSLSTNHKLTRVEKSIAARFGQVYYFTTFVSSVALFALGKRDYGTAALSIFAFDWAIHKKQCPRVIRIVFTVFLHAAAVATLVGYAKRLSTSLGQTVMSLIGMAVFLPKIAKVFSEMNSDDKQVPYTRKGRHRDPKDKFMDPRYYDRYGRECYPCPPVCLPQESHSSGRPPKNNGPSLGDLVTPLPHDL